MAYELLDIFFKSGTEVIQTDHFSAFSNKSITKVRTDKPSAPRNKYFFAFKLHLLFAQKPTTALDLIPQPID